MRLSIGNVDTEEKWVAPTLVLNPSLEEPLMTQEIFGPVLPTIS